VYLSGENLTLGSRFGGRLATQSGQSERRIDPIRT